MYSLLAFLMTFAEIAAAGCGYALHMKPLLHMALVYGAPFTLVMNLLRSESVFLDSNHLYLALLIFHILKYVVIFRAQFVDDRNILRTSAFIFEAAYLCASAYYTYFMVYN